MVDIFVSYTNRDRRWAHWIAEELQALGHVPHVHEWEIKGGDDVYAWMERHHDAADHVLCVTSDEYLKAPYSTLERSAALWQTAAKRPGFVLLVVVEPCRLPTLSDHIRRCELFGVPEDAARLRLREFMAARPQSGPSPFPGRVFAATNIPIHVPVHFMGRDEALEAIQASLGRYEGRVAVTALYGLQGVGKTTLAAAYAERHRTDYRATWWVHAQTEPTMRADLVALGMRLGWVGAEETQAPALAVVMERLRHEGEGILLVFDNAVDARHLTPYLPRGGAARVIITSNAHAWRGVAEPVEIRLWPKAVGADYLTARTGREAERDAAEALSETLGGLPLAHEQAAAYCERLEIALSEYSRRFAAAPACLLDDHSNAPVEYHDGWTVAKTFSLAIEEAGRLHPAAELLIVLAALLAPEPIPLFLLREGRTAFGQPLASLLAEGGLDEAVAALRTFALVDRKAIPDEREPATATDIIRLHRLVREVAAARLPTDAHGDARRALMSALIAVYPANVYNDLSTWPRCAFLLPHASLLMTRLDRDSHLKNLPDFLNSIGNYLHRQGSFVEAEKFYKQATESGELFLGRQHSDVARSLNDLAHLYQDTNRYAAAEPLYKEAIEICVKLLGPEHPRTAVYLNNLGNLYRVTQRYVEAAKLIEQAIRSGQEILGRRSPALAIMLANFATLHRDIRHYGEAEALYKEAIDIGEEVYGRRHANVATWLNSLAELYRIIGRYSKAEVLYKEAIDIGNETLGRENPDVVGWFNSLNSLRASLTNGE